MTDKHSPPRPLAGGYLKTAESLEQLAAELLESGRPLGRSDYQAVLQSIDAHFAPIDGIEVGDLSSTGWGVIFSASTSPEVVEALLPLLKHRRAVAARFDQMGYRQFEGTEGRDAGYRKGESAADFLCRVGARPRGPVVPEALPYYLLLVGSPEDIPFSFQYELDVEYGVGRIWFETPEEYRRYALAVVAAERGDATPARHGVFFAPSHSDGEVTEPMTQLSIEDLVCPLARHLEKRFAGEAGPWTFETVCGEAATKPRLTEIFERRDAPGLIFTAGHGLALPNQDPRQRDDQGAVVCSEWPGGELSPSPEHCFAAGDVPHTVDLTGSIVFQFACFSAGTPSEDDFKVIYNDYLSAGSPFLARLSQRLLAPPSGGGALAFIGHIDRVWAHSFLSDGPSAYDRVIYEQTLGRLLEGHPIGHAMELFNRCYAEQAVRIANSHDRFRKKEGIDLKGFAEAWLIHNDARNFIVIGDPAVRLKPGVKPKG